MKLSRLEVLIVILIAIFGIGTFVVSKAIAEQSPGTPNSGVNSILKETYETLKSLDYGFETGSNGAIWNRIISSANWVPNTGLTEADVLKSKTFYEDSRTIKTGTLDFPLYTDQSLQAKDFRDSNASSTWASWTLTSGAATTGVYKDNRTGLYWSPKQAGIYTNEFTIASCDFFTTTPRGNYNGADPDCGNAINVCANLSLDANGDATPETKWYLPTQAELMQAYLNGIYLGTNPTWVTGDNYWSSTEYNFTIAWYPNLSNGITSYNNKTSSYSVHCVHRDL